LLVLDDRLGERDNRQNHQNRPQRRLQFQLAPKPADQCERRDDEKIFWGGEGHGIFFGLHSSFRNAEVEPSLSHLWVNFFILVLFFQYQFHQSSQSGQTTASLITSARYPLASSGGDV
jgi:hypothetical protein